MRLGGVSTPLSAELISRTTITKIHSLPPHTQGCTGLRASVGRQPDQSLTLAAGATCHLAVALRPFVRGA